MSGDPTAPLHDASTDAVWTPGQAIGRYVVLRSIGEGGCGEVVAAFDPVLDRNVALKLLRGAGSGAGTLLREARTLAQLNHPHIVTIHDAGLVGDTPFLAMELVDGSDLRTWLGRSNRPSWPEIVELLCNAGTGLAAAHERGVVHGDVKPANILVGHGRALMTDFGVAVWDAEQGHPQPDYEPENDAIKLVGTPAFMAPEQYEGSTADARSDQYALCQTIWEALFGQPAFATRASLGPTQGERATDGQPDPTGSARTTAAELATLAEAKHHGPPALPASSRVPHRIVDALQRGMHPDPAARWPSVWALLEALRFDPWPRRRRWLAGLGALGIATAASLGTSAWVSAQSPCEGAAEALGDLAGPRLDRVDRALQGPTGYADDVRAYVSDRLRDQVQRWQAMHRDACEATTIRGEQSHDMLDRRMLCLDRARQRLDATTQVLIDEGTDALPRAHSIVGGLGQLSSCEDLQALAAELPPPEDVDTRTAVTQIRATLAQSGAVRRAGHYETALAQADAAVERARKLDHPPVLAEALVSQGSLLEVLGRYVPAEAALGEAVRLGFEHGPHRAAVLAAAELAYLYAFDILKPDRAVVYGELASSLARRHFPGDAVEAMALTNEAAAAYALGDLKRATELDQRSLEVREQALGPDDPTIAEVVENLSHDAAFSGDYAEAERLARRAYSTWTRVLGPEHPNAVLSKINVAHIVHMSGGRPTEAAEMLEEALAAQEAAFGDDSPQLAMTLNTMGEIYDDLGRWNDGEAAMLRALAIMDRAAVDSSPVLGALGGHYLQVGDPTKGEAMLRRALEAKRATRGPDHLELAPTYLNLGGALMELERYDEARQAYARGLELWAKHAGPDHRDTVVGHLGLGRLELKVGRLPEALEHSERALRIASVDVPIDHPGLVVPLLLRARVQRVASSEAEARQTAIRALEIAASPDVMARDRGDVAMLLAELEWDLDRRDRARELAEQARDAFTAAGPLYATDLAAAVAWLREHPAA